MGCCALLQGLFPTQGWKWILMNPALCHLFTTNPGQLQKIHVNLLVMLAPFPPRIPDGPSWSISPISLQPHLGPLPSFPAWLFPSISIPSFTICQGNSGLLTSLSAGCHTSASNSHLSRSFPHLWRPYQGVKHHIQ